MRCEICIGCTFVLSLGVAACGGGDSTNDDGNQAAAGTGGKTGAPTGGASNAGGSASAGAPGSGGTPTGGSAGSGGQAQASGGNGGAGGSAGGPTAEGGNPACEQGVWCNITPPGLYDPSPNNPPFGATGIDYDPSDPAIVWVSTDMEGIWKSTDFGGTWSEHNGNLPTPFSGDLLLDPEDSSHMYFKSGVRGAAMGFWVTTDGGENWAQPAAFSAGASAGPWNNDVGHAEADPSDFNHVLVSFHSPWSEGDAGIIETTDGGDSWIVHEPMTGWGASASIDFLYSPEQDIGDSSTWLLGTPYDGMWRTTDAGEHWSLTNAGDTGHGGTHLFYAKTGVLYGGATHQMIRSTDNGENWTFTGPYFQDEYYCVIGDGNFLYAQESNTGYSTVEPQAYIVSAEDDGMTWTDYNDQTFLDGPYRMAFDPVNRIIYSANWNGGVWSLAVNP